MTDTEQGEFMFVVGSRQLAFGLFLVIALMVTFAALAYVVGRMASPVQASSTGEARQEKVLVIEAAAGQQLLSEARVPAKAPEPVAAPPSARPPAPTASYFREAAPGQLYLQVAAADRGVAAVFAEYLTRRSFPCRVATGPDERSYRVLVGPIKGNEQLAKLRVGLKEYGFRPFLRRYKQAEATSEAAPPTVPAETASGVAQAVSPAKTGSPQFSTTYSSAGC